MCDTLGRVFPSGALFAKNSDRSPNEVQVLEYFPAQTGLSGEVNCTYISIHQVERTYAVLLSRPTWMWGAEIGVNEFGVCIGNEAVFTKGAYGKTGLTGMDLVRLALERSRDAKEALDIIISLLEEHGQGGNCGYDHNFYYDNAFLIMDRNTLYVLETAGKEWVYKQYPQASISNRLSVGADGDAYSGGRAFDFCRKYTEPVYTTFSGSAYRKQQTNACLPVADTLQGCMKALRSHKENVKNPFAAGAVSSACMHYGGLVGDHTTASMIVSLEENRTVVWNTGSSVPCISLFKPWLFGAETTLPVAAPGDQAAVQYWTEAEQFRRSLIGKTVPEEFYVQRDALQQRWIELAAKTATEDFPALSRACLAEETEFFRQWNAYPFAECQCSGGFKKRWQKKSDILFPAK